MDRGQIEELARSECQQGPAADVALVEVDAVTRHGMAHCANRAPSAKRIVGVSEARLGDLAGLFQETVADAVQLDRLVCGVGVFEFTADGVVIRAVGPRLTAREVQDALPFRLYAAPDLKRIE